MPLSRSARSCLPHPTRPPALRSLPSVIVAQLPNCACAIHRFFEEDVENAWTVIGVAGDISPESAAVGSGNRLMAPLVLESPETLIYSSADILREDYAHLHISRSVSSIAYIPLLQDDAAGRRHGDSVRFPELRGCRISRPLPDCPVGNAGNSCGRELRKRSGRTCSTRCTGCRSSTTLRSR